MLPSSVQVCFSHFLLGKVAKGIRDCEDKFTLLFWVSVAFLIKVSM